MKNYLYILFLLSAGTILLNSCATLSTAYIDDIYYNPDATNTSQDVIAEKSIKNTEYISNEMEQMTVYQNSTDTVSDDFEYAKRLQRFHNENYDGKYYTEEEEDANWNMSFNMGFGTYGAGWGMNFGYGYPYSAWFDPFYSWYYPYYAPWNYGWYDPFYSWYSPWYNGWYNPYSHSYHYYPYGDYVYFHDDDDRGYNYGPRRGGNTNSGNGLTAVGGVDSNIRKRASNPDSGTATNSSDENVRNSTGIVRVKENLDVNLKDKQLGGTRISTNVGRTDSNLGSSETGNTSAGERVKISHSYQSTDGTSVKTSNKNRSGYTPSYTRPSTRSTRTYNNSSSNSSVSGGNATDNSYRTGTSTRNSNYNSGSRTNSSGSTYTAPRSNSSTNQSSPRSNSSGTINTAPQRTRSSSSGSSYTAPKSSGNSSSGSSYSTPSSTRSSNSSGSSSGTSSTPRRR